MRLVTAVLVLTDKVWSPLGSQTSEIAGPDVISYEVGTATDQIRDYQTVS